MECGYDGPSEVSKQRHHCGACGLSVHAGEVARCRMNRRARPAESHESYIERPRVLVGTALKGLIAWFGEIPGGSCGSCSRLADKMDRQGALWCEDNRAKIVSEMVSRRSLLESALRQHAGHLVGSLAGWIPDAVLRLGASWLLSRAIETASPKPIDTTAIGQHWATDDALIMTAADDRFLPGAYLALATAREYNAAPMLFVSLGCDRDNPFFKRIEQLAEVREFTQQGDFDNWQTWWKPRYIDIGLGLSPHVNWLDADTVTGGSLEALTQASIVVPDHGLVIPRGNHNRPEFYKEMPPPRRRWGQQLPCCGILGISDREFVREWSDSIDFVTARPHLRIATAYSDQGLFQDAYAGDLIPGTIYNNFLVDRSTTLEQALRDRSRAVVNHYGGPKKPWFRWGDRWELPTHPTRPTAPVESAK